MSKSLKTFVSVSVVAVLVLATIGISYAYLTDNLSGGDSSINIVDVSDGRLEFAYSSGSSFEISDVNAGKDAIYAKTFSVKGTNNNSNNLNYKISLVIDENTFNDNEISFTLDSYNPVNNGVIIPSSKMSIKKGNNTILLGNGYFNNADSVVHTYNIKFYLNSNNKSGELKAHIESIKG